MKEHKKHSILPQAEEFLQETMKINITKIEERHLENYSFTMKDHCSMLSVTGDFIEITVIISFELPLLEQIIKNFLNIKKIPEDDKEALFLDAAGEIINIIVGLANPKYIKRGANLRMSTPVKIKSVNDIVIPSRHSVLNEQIYTEVGCMDISIITKA